MRHIEIFISLKNKLLKENVNLQFLTLACLSCFTLSLHATTIVTETVADTLCKDDTVRIFTEKVLFPKSSAVVSLDFDGNNVRVDSICSFLSKTDPRFFLSVKVTGSYSPEGKSAYNVKLAGNRADAVVGLIRKFSPDINPAISIVPPPLNVGDTDWYKLRTAELQIVWRNNAATENKSAVVEGCPDKNDSTAVESFETDTTAPLASPNTAVVTSGMDDEQTESRPHSGYGFGSRLFITTNMLYDIAMTPNIGVGMRVSDRVTILADWMYARWNNHEKRLYWRIYGGDVEVRRRLGRQMKGSPLGGHHLGAYASMVCYDFQAGRTHTGVLSDKYNYTAGLSYTYSLPVSSRLNIDFNLGVGYLWGTYKKHIPVDEHDVWLSTHKLGWFGPTRVGITLIWLVGNNVANNKKGGGL